MSKYDEALETAARAIVPKLWYSETLDQLKDHDREIVMGLSKASLDAILSVYAEPDEAMSWQPIETAPKDRWFLAYKEGVYYQLRWTEALSECGGYISEPTHWMELPAPPKGAAHD